MEAVIEEPRTLKVIFNAAKLNGSSRWGWLFHLRFAKGVLRISSVSFNREVL